LTTCYVILRQAQYDSSFEMENRNEGTLEIFFVLLRACSCNQVIYAHPLLGLLRGAKLMTLPYKRPGVGQLLSTLLNNNQKRNRQTLKFAGPHVCVVKLRNCNESLPLSHYAFGRQQDSCVNVFLKRGREMISDLQGLVMLAC
jgi:hypothetical protein